MIQVMHARRTRVQAGTLYPNLRKGNAGWAFLPVNHGLDEGVRLLRQDRDPVGSGMPTLLRALSRL